MCINGLLNWMKGCLIHFAIAYHKLCYSKFQYRSLDAMFKRCESDGLVGCPMNKE